MDVVLSVKNMSKVIKPTTNSVILFDGKDWYVTTKEHLFKEFTKLLNDCNNKLAELEQQNSDFKRAVSEELKEMTDLIQRLFDNTQGENL